MGQSVYRVMKECKRCNKELPKVEYRRYTASGNAYYLKCCPDCTKSTNSAPDQTVQRAKRLAISLRHKYGITPEENQAMHDAQGGICAIEVCSRPATRIDHSHANGQVRGRLCHKCNIALNALEERHWLDSAVKYLNERDPFAFKYYKPWKD